MEVAFPRKGIRMSHFALHFLIYCLAAIIAVAALWIALQIVSLFSLIAARRRSHARLRRERATIRLVAPRHSRHMPSSRQPKSAPRLQLVNR
jgi:hypothetical protein